MKQVCCVRTSLRIAMPYDHPSATVTPLEHAIGRSDQGSRYSNVAEWQLGNAVSPWSLATRSHALVRKGRYIGTGSAIS